MKTAKAETNLEIHVSCPYCGSYEDVTTKLTEYLEDDLRASGIEKEITCSECKKIFIVDEVIY